VIDCGIPSIEMAANARKGEAIKHAEAPSNNDADEFVSVNTGRGNIEADAFLATIVESSDDAIISKNLDAIITSWNRAAELMFGYRAEEAIGQPIYIVIPPELMEEEANILRRIRRGERVEHFQTVRLRKGGTRIYVSLTISPVRDRRGRIIGASKIARDITERKRIEEELAKAKEGLEHHARNLEATVAERTASLQETIFQLESFSYSITHDMRGPLRAISGYAHVLQEDHSERLDERARDLVARMGAAATRLDRLIQDVLTYSRIAREEMPMETVSLRALIEDIVAQYPEVQQHSKNIEIACGDERVRANPAALTQCISNLLGNAVKFVAPGQTPRVRVFCEERGENARLWVEDNGIGISAEQQKQIFGVFHRLHGPSEYPGTGIGLAIVKRSVERMNGNVGVESDPGRGSRFWIELAREQTAKVVSQGKEPA
jgi:PAS domain S-box-containing protein